MNRNKWFWAAALALPLAVAGLAFAATSQANLAGSKYCCPVTGECLPCEQCCPLNQDN